MSAFSGEMSVGGWVFALTWVFVVFPVGLWVGYRREKRAAQRKQEGR